MAYLSDSFMTGTGVEAKPATKFFWSCRQLTEKLVRY
jgi:hypothetical protein